MAGTHRRARGPREADGDVAASTHGPVRRFLRRCFGGELAGITVLLILLGTCFALVAPNFDSCHGSQTRVAFAQLANVEAGIEAYRKRLGRLPASLEDLTTAPPDSAYPFMQTIPQDPWGNAFEYERLDGTFRLRSLGEDGEPGTDDDIVWPWDSVCPADPVPPGDGG